VERSGHLIYNTAALIGPEARVEGEQSGWITNRGGRIIALAEVLRQRPSIELTGDIHAIKQVGMPAPRLEASASACPTASLTYDGES